MTGGTESRRYSESSFRDAESNTIHLDVTESPLAAPHRRGALMTRIWSLVDMPQVCRSTAHARASHLRECSTARPTQKKGDEVTHDRKH